tara:strand:- start:2236 stop:2466 length:231 start_codon:yes stop_codon:yes gene_type:complete
MRTWSNGTYMEKSMRTKKIDDKHYIIKYNKVEEQNKRLSIREIIPNISINPFLVKKNYIKDIKIQDEFLIPQNSNY